MSFRTVRELARPWRVRALLGLVVMGSLAIGATATSSPVTAQTGMVTIVDNSGGFTPGEALTGEWTFLPNHIAVVKGEVITFVSPDSNARPHSVTSIANNGRFPMITLEYGTKFNSSTSQAELIAPGGSFALDTGTLDAGHYTYYCALHPWMVGSITVMPE